MASPISKLCSFFSNSMNCNLTASAFDFLSFFIYLLSLFCYLYYYSFISYSCCNYFFLICIYFFFIWTCLLGGFVCTIVSYFCYMGAHDHVTQLLLYSPIIHIFILKFSTIGMVPFAERWNVTDTYFFHLMKALFLLGWKFWQHLFIQQL